MAEEGSKDVPVTGKGDKRMITGLLGCTPAGKLLPPQLIYQGTTKGCHPPESVNFPKDWNISHSANHWSNQATMAEYFDKVLFPYFAATKKELGLPKEQKSLVVLDVFKAHTAEATLKLLEDNNVKHYFVPASCTGDLQPLDVSGNKTFKDSLEGNFTQWYADIVTASIDDGEDISNVQVSMQLSYLKPIHARWLISAFDHLKSQPDCILAGWVKSGLREAIDKARE